MPSRVCCRPSPPFRFPRGFGWRCVPWPQKDIKQWEYLWFMVINSELMVINSELMVINSELMVINGGY